MQTTIINSLQINATIYDDYIYMNFVKWCQHHAKRHGTPIRALVTDHRLINWYAGEWHNQVEKPFIAEHREFLLADIQDPDTYAKLIGMYPKNIINTWPEILLNELKKAAHG